MTVRWESWWDTDTTQWGDGRCQECTVLFKSQTEEFERFFNQKRVTDIWGDGCVYPEPDIVRLVCNPSTEESEVGRPETQDQTWIHNKLEPDLSYMRALFDKMVMVMTMMAVVAVMVVVVVVVKSWGQVLEHAFAPQRTGLTWSNSSLFISLTYQSSPLSPGSDQAMGHHHSSEGQRLSVWEAEGRERDDLMCKSEDLGDRL